jgi:hypothetical protein
LPRADEPIELPDGRRLITLATRRYIATMRAVQPIGLDAGFRAVPAAGHEPPRFASGDGRRPWLGGRPLPLMARIALLSSASLSMSTSPLT